jgi:hypothetical protein
LSHFLSDEKGRAKTRPFLIFPILVFKFESGLKFIEDESKYFILSSLADMIPEIPAAWRKCLEGEREKSYFKQLESFVADEQEEYTVYPPPEKIFTALELTSYEDTRVLLLGQDPYIQKGQAHGLAFSVEDKTAADSAVA